MKTKKKYNMPLTRKEVLVPISGGFIRIKNIHFGRFEVHEIYPNKEEQIIVLDAGMSETLRKVNERLAMEK